MVILTLLHPQRRTPLRQWHFQTEAKIRVGRAPDNHVVLNDLLVSRYHLELHQLAAAQPPQSDAPTAASQWHLVNHSANGTFLNGHAISQSCLASEGLIQLAQGGPILKFEMEFPTLQVASDPASSSGSAAGDDLAADKVLVAKSPPLQPSCTHANNPPENLFCVHCGQPIRIEQTIRQYQILRVLGQGGMGTTYLAVSQHSQIQPHARSVSVTESPMQLVVLKEMNADIAQIPKAQELFEREANTLKSLNHPGIPTFYDFFLEDDKKYLVMELVHGQDLEKWVRQHGPVMQRQAIRWILQTCEVLDYLHSRTVPIIHRDIKPGNLMVRHRDARIVVLDFGAVKAVGMPPGTRIGAEGYSAPEQMQGRALRQSDLYAVGCSLIFLLSAGSPRRFYKRHNRGYRIAVETIPNLSSQLARVIRRATEPQPSDRYQTAKELAKDLSDCL